MTYYIKYNPCIASVDDLICFSNVLLRWQHDAPGKLYYNINERLYLYEIMEMFKEVSGSLVARMKRHESHKDKFEYYIDKYEYLFFLRTEIEIVEKKNTMLTLVPVDIPECDNDILCTQDNICSVASMSINAICLHSGEIKNDNGVYLTTKDDGSKRFGTRGVVIPPEKIWPKIPNVPSNQHVNLNKKQLFERGAEYISLLRSLGQNNTKILAQETKNKYPNLNDPSLGRLISPPGEEKRKISTYRQRARRALGKVP